VAETLDSHSTIPTGRRGRAGSRKVSFRTAALSVALGVASLWWLAVLMLVMARWIDPPTTAVHIQRHLQAWIHGKPHHERYRFVPLSQISPEFQHAVIAAEDARFATPGVNIGLFCSTPMVALSRAVGRKRALEMLLTGEPIDAATAREWGLVNRVVPAGRLHPEALALAERIASASRTVVGIGKAAFYAQIERDTAGAYAYTKEVMTMNALTEDAREGIGAFLEKRPPVWRH